jgi:hypothetical protein
MNHVRPLAAMLALLFALTISAKDARKELLVNLKFTPQESVHSTSPDLSQDLLDRAVEIRVEDGRRLPDASVIGEGTNDDDQLFPIRAENDVIAYLTQNVTAVSNAWSLKSGHDRVLTLTVSRFFVNESNKPIGSMYTAEVKLGYTLATPSGAVLAKGVGSGEAHRYGRARSADNCSEVLSDALKQAYAEVLGDGALQTPWISGKAAAGSASAAAAEPKETPEERLQKLDALYKKGLITKEEYEKKRAEILKEL